MLGCDNDNCSSNNIDNDNDNDSTNNTIIEAITIIIQYQ